MRGSLQPVTSFVPLCWAGKELIKNANQIGAAKLLRQTSCGKT